MNVRSLLLVLAVAATGLVAGMWIHLLVDDGVELAMAPPAVSPTGVAPTQPGEGFRFSAPELGDVSLSGLRFFDAQGNETTLGELDAQLVLLNLWATWCGPCRAEMPTLDRLQALLGGSGLAVVALSIDANGHEVVPDFYQSLGIENLEIYLDPAVTAPGELQAMGVPTTVLIDSDGREIGRHLGPAEWDSAAVLDAIRPHL